MCNVRCNRRTPLWTDVTQPQRRSTGFCSDHSRKGLSSRPEPEPVNHPGPMTSGISVLLKEPPPVLRPRGRLPPFSLRPTIFPTSFLLLTSRWKQNLCPSSSVSIHQLLAEIAFVTMETGLGASLTEAPPPSPTLSSGVDGCSRSTNRTLKRV